MISTDGADHQRLRKCLAPMFTRRAMESWERRVEAVVEQLLAPLAAGDTTYDLIADFTMVPTIIVAEMLGVPEDRHADFRRWSDTIVSNLAWGREDEEARAAMLTAATEPNAYPPAAPRNTLEVVTLATREVLPRLSVPEGAAFPGSTVPPGGAAFPGGTAS